LATLGVLSAEGQPAFTRINAVGKALMDGITEIAARCSVNLQVSGLPSAFHTCFASHPIHDYVTYMRADHKRLGLFLGELLECGVRPTSRGTWFVSAAHSDNDVASTLDAVQRSLQSIRERP